MTEHEDPRSERPRRHGEFWTQVVCPTAGSLESFFWKLAWFVLLVCLLFYSKIFA